MSCPAEIYSAAASLPPRVWMALGLSLVAASAITLLFHSFGEDR